MTRPLLATVVAVAFVATSAPLTAQGPLQAPFKNLQIFPKDVQSGVLVNAMKNFTRALGVRCQHCHIGEEGMPLEKFDFVADTKPEKQTARAMMRMTAEINGHVGKAIPDAAAKGYQVTCFTCHRGSAHPQHAPDIPKGELR